MSFVFSRWLFLRLLGIVYLIALVSLGVQMNGLVGSHGILPVAEFLAGARTTFGPDAYRMFPTLLWLWSGDAALAFLSWAGAVLSILLIAGFAPVPILASLWAFYLSLTVAGQVFLEFQWDTLLLEVGLLACLYAPLRSAAAEPNPIVRWVVWSLAFKLTFLSGITKILSGDPTWANWTAMTYHYQTQPLPTWTGWYAHHVFAAMHYWSVPFMLAIELVVPFALFLPCRFRKTRLLACVLMILLQAGIAATGNYGFFNLLTIVLYLVLLDDASLRPYAVRRSGEDSPPPEPKIWRTATSVAAAVIACLSVVSFVREIQVTARTPAQIARTWPGRVLDWVSPFRSINGYGLFRVMTTARPEIVIEVSENGRDFQDYEFRWKPGNLKRRPAFVEPHMPRLDWQMWFAALDPPGAQYWLESLLRRILDNEPAVRGLLGPDPLRRPPNMVRLAYYDYRFTTPEERAESGAWWVRTLRGYLTSAER
jgi:lipase maturation factor 1